MPTCVAVAIGCDLCPRILWRQLDVVCACVCVCGSWVRFGVHACGDSGWIYLAPACMAVTVECVWSVYGGVS